MFRKTFVFIGIILGTLVITGAEIDLESPISNGNPVKFRSYGEGEFSGHATISVVTVNGMPPDATVNVTYKNAGDVLSADAVMAVEVDLDGGRFLVHRDNDNNTSGLEFYWSAEWEEEVEE